MYQFPQTTAEWFATAKREAAAREAKKQLEEQIRKEVARQLRNIQLQNQPRGPNG